MVAVPVAGSKSISCELTLDLEDTPGAHGIRDIGLPLAVVSKTESLGDGDYPVSRASDGDGIAVRLRFSQVRNCFSISSEIPRRTSVGRPVMGSPGPIFSYVAVTASRRATASSSPAHLLASKTRDWAISTASGRFRRPRNKRPPTAIANVLRDPASFGQWRESMVAAASWDADSES